MKLIMLGIQGSGKGTQSKKLSEKYGMLHICVGDLLRDHISKKTVIGLEYEKEYVKGNFAPDDIIFQMLDKELKKKESNKKGYILDGFPRSPSQMEWLDQHHFINKCVHLNITKRTALKRLKERNRPDDNDKSIKQRISDYFEKTAPLLEFYKKQHKVEEIDGSLSVEETFKNIEIALKLDVLKK